MKLFAGVEDVQTEQKFCSNLHYFSAEDYFSTAAEDSGAHRRAAFRDPIQSADLVIPDKGRGQKNKLASLEATLVRNSAHPLTHLLTHRGKV